MKKIILILFLFGVNVLANAQQIEVLKDITPKDVKTSNGTYPGDSYIQYLTKVGNKAYFVRDAKELWITDCTEAGTVMVKSFTSSIMSSKLYEYNGDVYFGANDGSDTGHELWKSDGTLEGTTMIKEIRPGKKSCFSYGRLDAIVYKSKLFFWATGQNEGGLYSTDGTAQGTKIIFNGISVNSPETFTVFDNKLYFPADDFSLGVELWVTDGRVEGTKLFYDIRSGSWGSYPRILGATENNLFIAADGTGSGSELYTVTKDANSVNLVKDFNPDDESTHFGGTLAVGDKYIFGADQDNKNWLWITQGTEASTTKILDQNGQPIQISNWWYSFKFKNDYILYGPILDEKYKAYRLDLNTNTATELNFYDSSKCELFRLFTPTSNTLFYRGTCGWDEGWYSTDDLTKSGKKVDEKNKVYDERDFLDVRNIILNNTLIGYAKFYTEGAELFKIDLGQQASLDEIGQTTIDFTLYPNPSTGKINIKRSSKEIAQLKVYNTLGKLIYDEQISGESSTFHIESSGIYYIKIKSQDNKTEHAQKIIITK